MKTKQNTWADATPPWSTFDSGTSTQKSFGAVNEFGNLEKLPDSSISSAPVPRKSVVRHYLNPKTRIDPYVDYFRIVSASPLQGGEIPQTPGPYIDLFLPDPDALICAGPTYRDVRTGYRHEHLDRPDSFRFVVPAYMNARMGMTVNLSTIGNTSRPSVRCNDNTGRSRFIVYVNERDPWEVQASLILLLAQKAPLVMVVETAHGNLEAWFSVIGRSIKDTDNFRSAVLRLGGSRRSAHRCQLFELPGFACDRCGVTNKVIYLDPQAVGARP